jgi:hypothetical protein
MATVTISSPQTNGTCTNNRIPVLGTVSPAGDPVTVSLYENGTAVTGQQEKAANVRGSNWDYTFANVAAGTGYAVTARSGKGNATVSGLTVTA